jgi:hypothetical protein
MSATLEHLPSLFALARQFDTNMKAGLAINIFPSLLIIGGVFFGHLGLLGATILNNAGLLAGVGVAMLPALQAYIHCGCGSKFCGR